MVLPFIAALALISGIEAVRNRPSVVDYEQDTEDDEVIIPDYPPPLPSAQPSAPNSSSSALQCPPIYIPESAEETFNEVLDIIHRCELWDDFCKTIIDVEHEPSAQTAQVGCSEQAYHKGLKGERCHMQIGTEFLGFPANDLGFAVLHEIYHAMRRYAGYSYGMVGEENDANKFADKKLKSIGISHNFRILPNGTVNRIIQLTGFGGGKRTIQKNYKL